MEKYLSYSTEVQEAMAQGKPVVALESTIISHGMPYPQNVKTAREVEQIVRDNGAVPATIAIIDGKIKIGLSDEELEMFGNSQGVAKASRRDLGYLIATKQLGATTVAATMICADLAGIRIFVTGGIVAFTAEQKQQWIFPRTWKNLHKQMLQSSVLVQNQSSISDLRLNI